MKNEITVQQKCINESLARLTAGSVSTIEEWIRIGHLLAGAQSALSWAIGDWLLHGQEEGYLPRGKLDEAAKFVQLSKKTIMNIVTVCKAFNSSLRREELSFSHHKLVAGKPDACELLDWASEHGASVADLRQHISKKRSNKKAIRSRSCKSTVTDNVRDGQRVKKLGQKQRIVEHETPSSPMASPIAGAQSDLEKLESPIEQCHSENVNVNQVQILRNEFLGMSPKTRLKLIVELVRGTDATGSCDVAIRLNDVIFALDLPDVSRMRCMMTLAHSLSEDNRQKVASAIARKQFEASA